MDTLFDVCIEIHKGSSKILDIYFIMNIFDDIGKDIPEFKNYLEYLFEIKKSRNVATRELVLNFDELIAEIFYSKHA